MRILLIDNSKPNLCEFTRLLEARLSFFSSDITCCNTVDEVLKYLAEIDPDIAILSGSSLNVSQPQKMIFMRKSITTLLRLQGIPVLGICFGMQLMCVTYGGVVKRLEQVVKCEDNIHIETGSVLLNNESCNINVTLSHQDYVVSTPNNFIVYSKRKECIQMFESLKFLRFGVQFHPERIAGNETVCILHNFIKFSFERSSIPPCCSHVPDQIRIRLMFSIPRNNVHKIRRLYDIDIDTIMTLWRHHMKIWNLPAILI